MEDQEGSSIEEVEHHVGGGENMIVFTDIQTTFEVIVSF